MLPLCALIAKESTGPSGGLFCVFFARFLPALDWKPVCSLMCLTLITCYEYVISLRAYIHT